MQPSAATVRKKVLVGKVFLGKFFLAEKKILKKNSGEHKIWQLAGGIWEVAVGRWHLAGGSWFVAVGRW